MAEQLSLFPEEEAGPWVAPVPRKALESILRDGGEPTDLTPPEGCIGWTLFDPPQAQDNRVPVILPREQVGRVPNRSLVRIHSTDGRRYLGLVVEGPFTEPDGIRADAPVVVAATAQGRFFLPRYHGRAVVEVLAEEVGEVRLPPRYRPFPNSPVFLLTEEETMDYFGCRGDLRLGRAIGYEGLTVGIPSDRKGVLPRHTAVLGTTGAGKSTTVARLVYEAQKAGMAVVLLDVEGEYTRIHEPVEEPGLVQALRMRGLQPEGVPNTVLYHLVGRETANPNHPNRRPFSLEFSRLSPYTVVALLDLTEAQASRFWSAYEATRDLLRELRVFPQNEEEQRLLSELDEFRTGYPKMTLDHLLSVASVMCDLAEGLEKEEAERRLREGRLKAAPFPAHAREVVERAMRARPDHASSWRALLGKLWPLHRLQVFDRGQPIPYKEMVQGGRVSIVDLSDLEGPEQRNLVIADILRGVHEAQEQAYEEYEEAERRNGRPPRTLVVVEEAHEFLSSQRIQQMPFLFQWLARVARRGRKRWLGLVLVTQHPQHLPAEVFGLVNNYILHRIADAEALARLRRAVGALDEALWERVKSLAPGQAVVHFAHMAHPLPIVVDPAPCRLRMAEE